MKVIIDNVDFWDSFEAQRYWSFPKSYSHSQKQTEAKTLATSGNYLGSRKMDGIWAMLIKDLEGKFHLRSRKAGVNGSFVDKAEWIPHICKELYNIPNGTVLLGEIYFPDNEGSRKVTSVFNCLKDKCIEKQKVNEWLHYYIFDILALNGKNLVDTNFGKRFKNIYEISKYITENAYVEIAEYKEGQELWDLYCDVINCGGEGIVITNKAAKYECGKKTARMTLKMKKELQDTIDAFIDGVYKKSKRLYIGKEIEKWCYWENVKTGEKVNKNMYYDYSRGGSWEAIKKAYYNNWAGSISFSVMKDGKPFHIGFISGIPDELKKGIVENTKDYIGKVAELSAMGIEHIGNEYSLRHGKIIGWRDDKRPEDCTFDQIAK